MNEARANQHEADKEIAENRKPAAWSQTARLYALMAPGKRVAVILRRGPSKQVRMILWDMAKDKFTPGQWLKARVYERRCDLSWKGDYFVYFAATYRAPYSTWTAVSRPPYFTALALWPKGDAWGGGGLFEPQGPTLCLNHRPDRYHPGEDEMQVADGFAPPKLRVKALGEASGWGEDYPIREMRMMRDGWTIAQEPSEFKWMGFNSPFRFSARRERILERVVKDRRGHVKWRLQLKTNKLGETQGRWNVEEAVIVDPKGKAVRRLGRVDWVDLDANNDVVWSWMGRLWRMKAPGEAPAFATRQPKCLADFNDMVFEEVAPPSWAKQW